MHQQQGSLSVLTRPLTPNLTVRWPSLGKAGPASRPLQISFLACSVRTVATFWCGKLRPMHIPRPHLSSPYCFGQGRYVQYGGEQ